MFQIDCEYRFGRYTEGMETVSLPFFVVMLCPCLLPLCAVPFTICPSQDEENIEHSSSVGDGVSMADSSTMPPSEGAAVVHEGWLMKLKVSV